MDTNKIREQFETAYAALSATRNGRFHPEVFTRGGDGEYVIPSVQSAWWGWQASRKAVVVVLPKVVGFEGAYDSMRHHEFVPTMSDVEDADEIFGLCRSVEVREAIEFQGLNVRVGEAQ